MELRRVRALRGLTQQDLARLSGLAQSTIAMLERRDSPDPPWSTVSKLARALKITPWQLFGERPPRTEVRP